MALRVPRPVILTAAIGLAMAWTAVGSVPALADQVRQQQWWLGALHVTQAQRTATGSGVTIALLDTGVDPAQPDLAGSVIAGPDLTKSGEKLGQPFFGVHGTAMASLIVGHGHGAGGAGGVLGVAPGAKLLSVRVTLDDGDPLATEPGVTVRPARRDRGRDQVRGQQRRPGHRPAAGPGPVPLGPGGLHRPGAGPGHAAHAGRGRPAGRGGRQRRRAGRRRLRAQQGRGPGRARGRHRHQHRRGELPRLLPGRDLRGRVRQQLHQGPVHQPPVLRDADRRRERHDRRHPDRLRHGQHHGRGERRGHRHCRADQVAVPASSRPPRSARP